MIDTYQHSLSLHRIQLKLQNEFFVVIILVKIRTSKRMISVERRKTNAVNNVKTFNFAITDNKDNKVTLFVLSYYL